MKSHVISRRFLWLLTVALIGGGLALGACAKDKTDHHAPLTLQVDKAPIDRNAPAPVSFAPVVKKAAASVVYVFSSKKVRQPDMSQYFQDPMFRRFFGLPGPGEDQPREQVQHSLGSGVIVTSNGYILTNNHVVDGADEVKIAIGEPRKEYKATIVGRDTKADIAVLKIDATGLPAATLGDSDQLEVGDTVLAIGDPFGIGLTVTHGIASAVGRGNLGIEHFENFIQTDAAINPGNSGGALLDSKGRVIGINTAILSRSGGFNGVGFAIPINLARSIAEQLVATGRVMRGFMGVNTQSLSPDLAAEFGVKQGALITDVEPDSPADKAGLKSGDIITKLNGADIEDPRRLQLAVIQIAPDTEVTVEYVREGKTLSMKFKLGELPSQTLASGNHAAGNDEGVLNGVTVTDITPEVRAQLQLPHDLAGALITDVDSESASAEAGLEAGDIVLGLNRKPVKNASEAVKLSEEIKGPKVIVRIWRKGVSRFILVDESEK
jgi:serine protease Do